MTSIRHQDGYWDAWGAAVTEPPAATEPPDQHRFRGVDGAPCLLPVGFGTSGYCDRRESDPVHVRPTSGEPDRYADDYCERCMGYRDDPHVCRTTEL